MNLDKLDIREFSLFKTFNYDVVLYQLDLIRIIKCLEKSNSSYLANKLKRIIYLKDKMDGTKSNFNKIKKVKIEKIIMSPYAYFDYVASQNKIDNDMKVFYGRK